MESKSRQFIESFNPKLERLDSATNVELSLFYAGSGFDSFSKYIQVDEWTNRSEAMNDIAQGRGVTHLIYNYKSDGTRDIVAYFTLSNNVIPYDDGIEDDRSDLSNYPSIPVAEIKMFAVSELYQDVFYRLDDMEMPIAAWCLHCGKEQTSFCNSHSIPKMILLNISENGIVYNANELINFHLMDKEEGIKKQESFAIFEAI